MSYPRFSLFLLFTILMAITGATIAARNTPTKDTDRKQPEWFYDHDGSFLIPGIGRVMVPTGGGFPTMPGIIGGDGSDDNIGGVGGDDNTGAGGGNDNTGAGGGDDNTGAGGTNGGYTPGTGAGGGDDNTGAGGTNGGYTPGTGAGGGDDNTGAGGTNGGYTPGTGAGGSNGGYIPGGDDTFVPNPGVEVPNPVGGSIP